VALSKTISEADALNRKNQVRRIFDVALVSFVILGAISFFVMYF
jgi:stage V sporulation protein B